MIAGRDLLLSSSMDSHHPSEFINAWKAVTMLAAGWELAQPNPTEWSFPHPLLVRWIKLDKVTGNRRLAECPHIIDPEDIGMPSYFIRCWLGCVRLC